MDRSTKLDINKYNKCAEFFNSYNSYLIKNYGIDIGYEYLYIAMTMVLDFFGEKSKYNKIVDISEKIYHAHIGRGFIKLYKLYPTFFRSQKLIFLYNQN